MNLKRVLALIVSSFVVSLAFYFLINRFVLNRSGGNAALAVNSLSASLTVTKDGEVLGKTPYYADALKSGEASLVLSGDLGTYRSKISLTAGALTVVNYSLGPSEDFSEGEIIWLEKAKGGTPDASLLVIADPDGAQVRLDEALLGEAPLSSRKMAAGDHVLKISKEGYKPRSIKIQGQTGYQLNVKARLFLLPFSAGAGQIDFTEEPRFKVTDFSSNQAALYADTSAWAKGIIHYLKSGSGGQEASLSAGSSYDLFVDFRGQIFDGDGVKNFQPTVKEKSPVRAAYLGRDPSAGLSEDAQNALQNLATKILPQRQRVQILPTGTGWLRVRRGPSLATEEIAKVNEGDKLPLLAEEGGYYQIQLPDDRVGFVSKNFARKIQ